MSDHDLLTPIAIPCPGWCGEYRGHGTENTEPCDPALEFRTHRLVIALVPVDETEKAASVEIEAWEESRHGVVEKMRTPKILVTGYREDGLTASDAQQFASALSEAGRRLSEITGAE
jgi:hypothetical protein